jgi:hypothetical protein
MEKRRSLEITAPTGVSPAPKARPSQMMGSRRTAMRIMNRKSVGVVAVYEQDPPVDNPNARALVFESAKGLTRLVEFPADWQRLSEEELAAIRRTAS